MAIGALVQKDLLILTRDRRALAMLLLMPMAFIAIIGLSTGRLFAERNQHAALRLVLVDQAHDELIAKLIDSLNGRDGITLTKAETAESALAQVDDGDQGAAVIVGPAFRSRVDALELGDLLDPANGRLAGGLSSVDVEVHARPTDLVARAMAEQLVFAATLRAILPDVAARHPVARTFLRHNAPAIADRKTETDPDHSTTQAIGLITHSGSLVYQFIVPGYTVLFMFFLINIMARSFIAERDQGTLLRMLVSPNDAASLLAGKALPYLLVSCVQGLVLFAFGKLLFGMSWGVYPLMLVPLIAGTALAATGLGLLTAVWVRSEAQVSAYGNLVVIVFAGVSGCFMPRDWLPEFMQTVSLATPHAWALIGYDQALVSVRPNVARILGCCVVLSTFGIGFFALSWLRFRSQVDR